MSKRKASTLPPATVTSGSIDLTPHVPEAPVETAPQPLLPRKRGRTIPHRRGGDGEPVGVTFNHLDVPQGRSSAVHLSRDRRTLVGQKGYRAVRTTRGVQDGAWYCEFTVVSHKPGGGIRLVMYSSVSFFADILLLKDDI